MRSRVQRTLAVCLLTILVAAPAAQATIVFKGFSAKREAALRSDLAKSIFPYASLLDVTVKPGDLPSGVLGLATSGGQVTLDPMVFMGESVRTFALLHELSHQVDFQLLEARERGRFYAAAGFGQPTAISSFTDRDWYAEIGSADHESIPAEQFASAVPLVVWPTSKGNEFVGEDGSCLGWDKGEGCKAPLSVVREIVNAILAQNGLPPLSGEPAAEPLEESFVPPRTEAPSERALRAPDAGLPAVTTGLAALAPLTGVTAADVSVLRVRLGGPLGALAGAPMVLDYRDEQGWWQLAELKTDRSGEISYRFRAKGWHPTAFRITFIGAANLTGASLVVPVEYR